MLSAAVQEVLKVAVQEVQRRRHELLTVEHILFSLTTVAPGRLLLEGSEKRLSGGFYGSYGDIGRAALRYAP